MRYRETDPLGGHDVYSMSKAAAELVVQSWRKSLFLPNPKLGNVASVRAGNVIGGGDYARTASCPIASARFRLPADSGAQSFDHATVAACAGLFERLSWLGARSAGAEKQTPAGQRFQFRPGRARISPSANWWMKF